MRNAFNTGCCVGLLLLANSGIAGELAGTTAMQEAGLEDLSALSVAEAIERQVPARAGFGPPCTTLLHAMPLAGSRLLVVVFTDACTYRADSGADLGKVTRVAFMTPARRLRAVETLAYLGQGGEQRYEQRGTEFLVQTRSWDYPAGIGGPEAPVVRGRYLLVALPSGRFEKRDHEEKTELPFVGRFRDEATTEELELDCLAEGRWVPAGAAPGKLRFTRLRFARYRPGQPRAVSLQVLSADVERRQFDLRDQVSGEKLTLTVAPDYGSLSVVPRGGGESRSFVYVFEQ